MFLFVIVRLLNPKPYYCDYTQQKEDYNWLHITNEFTHR